MCTISGSTVHLPARDKPWDCVNVVCLDDDARGSAAWKQANRAIRAARAAGHVVLIVNTWRVRRGDKTDLNDILRQSGPEGPALLRQRISTPLFPEAPRRKRLKPADTIKQVRAAATDFMALATRMPSGEEEISDVQVALRAIPGSAKATSCAGRAVAPRRAHHDCEVAPVSAGASSISCPESLVEAPYPGLWSLLAPGSADRRPR